MKEYVINCGEFNIIVLPHQKQYFIPDDDAAGQIFADFVAGAAIDYSSMTPRWFKYSAGETWRGFDGAERRLNDGLSEDDLIANFVLKKFNFGSLVAMRDLATGRVQVFKRDKLPVEAAA